MHLKSSCLSFPSSWDHRYVSQCLVGPLTPTRFLRNQTRSPVPAQEVPLASEPSPHPQIIGSYLSDMKVANFVEVIDRDCEYHTW